MEEDEVFLFVYPCGVHSAWHNLTRVVSTLSVWHLTTFSWEHELRVPSFAGHSLTMGVWSGRYRGWLRTCVKKKTWLFRVYRGLY